MANYCHDKALTNSFAFADANSIGVVRTRAAPALTTGPARTAAAGMQNLFAAGSVYVQEHFDLEEVVRIRDEEGVNRTVMVPAMIQALLVMVPGIEDREFADLDQIGYGASPIARSTRS